MQTNEVIIKNMVCNRCIKVVTTELIQHKIDFLKVELGKIFLKKPLTAELEQKLNSILIQEGFEIVKDSGAKLVNEIKTVIVKHIFHSKEINKHKNYSAFLAENLGIEYTHLSRIFSEKEGKTIEKYIILQKIERVKELIVYNELTFSQISYEMGYSSPQHMSRQFKKTTGLTPTEYKSLGNRLKLDTI